MPTARQFRRTSPITYVFAITLAIGLLYLLFSGDDTTSAPTKQVIDKQGAASSDRSPPSLPFRKSSSKGPIAPPPVVHYRMNNVTQSTDPIANGESILILTPLAKFYQEYWDNLLKLSYPHELISLGFILPNGKDGNVATAALQAQVAKTQAGPQKKRFSSITILRQDTESPESQVESDRHRLENQKARRAAMAKARNSLLFTTLGPSTSWVLWLDADIIETPPDLIQDLARHDKPIIVPNCFQRYYNEEEGSWQVRPYDYNNWVDSETAQELGSKMGNDDILLEGYAEMPTYRTLMARLNDESQDKNMVMQLDGVGGTALLVKADVHRDGAMFPPFAFYHLIETEGFAKMAARLGWKSWGLPNYFVYHYNE